MSWFLIGLGSAMLLVAALALARPMKPVKFASGRPPPWTIALVVGLSIAVLVVSVTSASHTVITSSDTTYNPSPWNGFKVYLSSPRHIDSGSRGECGFEENINGRHWNAYAAIISTGGAGSLYDRKYKVVVSANARDNGAVINKDSSNNWGANVHIVTHTNALNGCPSAPQYVLVMYRTGNANSTGLRTELLSLLDPVIPGGQQTWNCDGLIECNSVLASHRAYVELFFHDNQAAVNWFEAGGGAGNGVNNSWRYGNAVDVRLGYPR